MAKQLKSANQAQTIQLIANGDLRLSANQTCWPAQRDMERQLTKVVKSLGYDLKRVHSYSPKQKHGFISSQKEGMDVFKKIDPKAPLIVAESVWQYSHHILHGLLKHQGPILSVANWSGTWPGLVGMLNLNGSMTKMGIEYSTLWSEDFKDDYFLSRLKKWLETGKCAHQTKHVTALSKIKTPAKDKQIGKKLADQLQENRAIMGVFDEGCMGMMNALIPDDLLNATGVFKERLSQSALYYETTQITDKEAKEVYQWYLDKGMKFHLGKDPKTELTKEQVLSQCKMYIAAVRIADDFGCDCIGIQYQQGLKDLLPASDLVEGTLNSKVRPPVKSRDGKRTLYAGKAIPNYNEVDQCAGLDALMTNRVHQALKQPVENTLHDLRWGDWDQSKTVSDYVWVFLISGSVPAAHNIGGWAGSDGMRQPPAYFPLGGSTLRGISKPGEIIWSRIFMESGKLKMDLGRGESVKLPQEETDRRWEATTVQWPIMHAVTYGTSRDQMMARNKANHLQVAYAKSSQAADSAMLAKAAMANSLGIETYICGTRKNGKPW